MMHVKSPSNGWSGVSGRGKRTLMRIGVVVALMVVSLVRNRNALLANSHVRSLENSGVDGNTTRSRGRPRPLSFHSTAETTKATVATIHNASMTEDVCICQGATTQSEKIKLSSPFFSDGIFLSPGALEGCCSHWAQDNRTHVFFSSRYTQYGHFLLNGLAPLWDKLRNLEHFDFSNPNQLAIHFFATEKSNVQYKYLSQYLGLFSNQVTIQKEKDLFKTNVNAKRAVLGLSGIGLDHYNKNAQAQAWKNFRQFLIDGLKISPERRADQWRVTILQRQSNRQFIQQDELVQAVVQTLGNLTQASSKQIVTKVVLLEGKSVYEQATIFKNTDILVAADGTGLINGMYMPESSCILSFLPFGVPRLIPGKGDNFQQMFWSLGWKYLPYESLPVEGSDQLVQKAENTTGKIGRWFLLKQNIHVNHTHLAEGLAECVHHMSLVEQE